MDTQPAHSNRDSLRDSFKDSVALEITFWSSIWLFPTNNIISLRDNVVCWKQPNGRSHLWCTHIHMSTSERKEYGGGCWGGLLSFCLLLPRFALCLLTWLPAPPPHGGSQLACIHSLQALWRLLSTILLCIASCVQLLSSVVFFISGVPHFWCVMPVPLYGLWTV